MNGLIRWQDCNYISKAVSLFEPCAYGINTAAKYLAENNYSKSARCVAACEQATVFLDRCIQTVALPVFAAIALGQDIRKTYSERGAFIATLGGVFYHLPIRAGEAGTTFVVLIGNTVFNLCPYKFFNGLFNNNRHKQFFERRDCVRNLERIVQEVNTYSPFHKIDPENYFLNSWLQLDKQAIQVNDQINKLCSQLEMSTFGDALRRKFLVFAKGDPNETKFIENFESMTLDAQLDRILELQKNKRFLATLGMSTVFPTTQESIDYRKRKILFFIHPDKIPKERKDDRSLKEKMETAATFINEAHKEITQISHTIFEKEKLYFKYPSTLARDKNSVSDMGEMGLLTSLELARLILWFQESERYGAVFNFSTLPSLKDLEKRKALLDQYLSDQKIPANLTEEEREDLGKKLPRARAFVEEAFEALKAYDSVKLINTDFYKSNRI